jgi:aspartate aminotransferase
MKFSSRIEACSLSPIRKFLPYEVAAKAAGRTVHHLNIGQPDIETPQAFFDAVNNFGEKVLAYAPSPGVEVYLKAVQDYYQGLGFPIDLEDILATYGGSEALQIIFSCILEDGDEVLVPEPYYPNYDTFIRVTGATIHPVPTEAADGYRYASRELLESYITERTRAILVTNPGNPTGVVLTDEEMRVLADVAREHGLFLISDEVYRELVYGGETPTSMLRFPDAAENVIVVDSVSKRFSATGSRVGVIVSRNKELMGHAMKICQGRLCAATLDQVGAAALYRSMTPEYCAALRQEYQRRRDAVVAGLNKIPGVRFNDPEGAFYLMVTLPVDDAEKLQYFLLEEFEDKGETVMYAPGEGFYATPGKGRNEIRIAYVTNPDDLSRAVELLGLGIAAYNKKRG